MMKLTVLAVLLLLAMWSGTAYADSTPTPPPGWTGNYKLVSSDGLHVLIMLGDYPCPCDDADENTRALNALSQQYQSSGLYRNDGSTTPLWTSQYVDWQHRIVLSSDGHHMVEWGGWPLLGSYASLALTFYEGGKVSRAYTVEDLVADPRMLPRSVSHYRWLQDDIYDDVRGQLHITTLNNEQYVFDTRTGKVLSAVRPTREPVSVRSSETTLSQNQEGRNTAASPEETSFTPVLGLLASGLGLSVTLTIASALRPRRAIRRR